MALLHPSSLLGLSKGTKKTGGGPMVWEFSHDKTNKGCVTHYGLAIIYIKKDLLRQKKNYGNSNISSCKNIIFKKSYKSNQNPSR
jgi:hypothetical protein